MNRLNELLGVSALETRLRRIQFFLPLGLFLVTLLYQMFEHLVLRQETVFSRFFLGEVFFFGIVGPVIVFIALGWFRVQWRQKAEAEAEAQRMYHELLEAQTETKRLHALRGELLRKLISAQEAERSRVAREIHDELGQMLTRLSLNMKMLEAYLEDDEVAASEDLGRSREMIQQTQDQAYRLIHELRPTALDDLGLEAALRDEVKQRLVPLGIKANVVTKGETDRLPGEIATAVFRIVQEAISNVIWHANAQQVWMAIKCTSTALEVSVEDDGVGVPPDLFSRNDGRRTLGLLGMQERAMAMDGQFSIGPREPRGAQVHLWVPLTRP